MQSSLKFLATLARRFEQAADKNPSRTRFYLQTAAGLHQIESDIDKLIAFYSGEIMTLTERLKAAADAAEAKAKTGDNVLTPEGEQHLARLEAALGITPASIEPDPAT